MKPKKHCVREWLASVDPDLAVYADKFEEFGYNLRFLREADAKDLAQDLKEMSVKRVHCRVILQHHAALKKRPLPEASSSTAAPVAGSGLPSRLHGLVPCIEDVLDFEYGHVKEIGSGRVVLVPIWCLRWVQDKVHSQMTFTSGNHKDRSVYELFHDLVTNRLKPEDIEPLDVIVEAGELHIVRGHRRAAMLASLQGMRRHRAVKAPCRLYDPMDSKVANRRHARDTSVNSVKGVGLQPHGHKPEAWHMGKPLFRCAQEWCDVDKDGAGHRQSSSCSSMMPSHEGRSVDIMEGSLAAMQPRMESGMTAPDMVPSEAQRKEASTAAAPASSSGVAEPSMPTFVCCLWLEGKCHYNRDHKLGKKFFVHQDVPGMPCGYGTHCEYLHYEKRATSPSTSRKVDSLAVPTSQVQLASSCVNEKDCAVLQVGMVAYFESKRSMAPCEVLSISSSPAGAAAPVQVRCGETKGETRWVSVSELQIPDYSAFQPGQEVSVAQGGGIFSCKVRKLSKHTSAAFAPVQVRFNGRQPEEDEWVGADRLRTKALKFVPAILPPPGDSEAGPKHPTSPKPGAVTLQRGMRVCFQCHEGSLKHAEVLQISASADRSAAPVQVLYLSPDSGTGWFAAEDLQVPDYSGLHKGLQVAVTPDGQMMHDCRVLTISRDRPKEPVLVHYCGYDSDDDEWVGADRLRSKALTFAQAQLPASFPHMATNDATTRPTNQTAEPTADGSVGKLKLPGPRTLQPGMVVCVMSESASRASKCGEVLEVSSAPKRASAPVKVWLNSQEAAWFHAEDLQIPDFSALELGLRVQVKCESKTYLATVMQNCSERPATPIRIHYNGYAADEDEWVGADRLVSKALKFLQPLMPAVPIKNSAETGHVMKAASPGHVELQAGMLVYDAHSSTYGEVLLISPDAQRAAAPVKVRLYGATTRSSWLGAGNLRVPDYSNLRAGVKLAVLSGGIQYDCTVLEISRSKGRSKAPVHVRYNGYSSQEDEWVGADRIRSKDLGLVQATVPFVPVAPEGEQRTQSEAPPVRPTAAAVLDKGSASTRRVHAVPHEPAMPWDEPGGSEDEDVARGLDAAIQAVEVAVATTNPVEQKRDLEKALQKATGTAHVRKVLAEFGWNGLDFPQTPDLKALKEQLLLAKAELHESNASWYTASEVSDEEEMDALFNDVASSCAPESREADLEAELERQLDDFESLKNLMNVLIYGTFRCVSGGNDGQQQKRCGEVIVERGPACLRHCKVHILAGKNRGQTWDSDRCYVRILFARAFSAESGVRRSPVSPTQTHTLDCGRTELLGRVLLAKEFGASRQKHFVCLRSKVVRSKKSVSFQPINGKLPGIHVRWNEALDLPSSHDLHVVEVTDWSPTFGAPERRPRGRYVQSLRMQSRNTDASILEAVQISLNFTDWKRGDTRRNMDLFVSGQFPRPDGSMRADRRGHLAVGIQHPSLPTSMVMSYEPAECLQVHILDVNAYLDQLGLESLENLVRRRSVGAWFLDHKDMPLEANLPLFPPDIEKELSFREGSERLALTFTFTRVANGELDPQSVCVTESVVRCDRLLNPQSAGLMLLGKKNGGEVGDLLRRLAGFTEKFEDSQVSSASFAVLEHLDIDFAGSFGADDDDSYAPLAASRFLRTCMHMVDRHAGRLLQGSPAWSALVTDETTSPICVRHSHGRPDPSTWKVIERLLRVRPEDRNKPISVSSILTALRQVLCQPGLSYAVRHGFQSSFLRRLRAVLPHAYYEADIFGASNPSVYLPGACCESSLEEPLFHVSAPLQRYIDILGMRALKLHLWRSRALCKHLQMSCRQLQESVARFNARSESQKFGLYICRMISWMRELSDHSQRIFDAVIGAVGPTYINVLIPSPSLNILELKIPVHALCSSTCISEYDATTQSIKLTMSSSSSSDPQTLHIPSWYAPMITCTLSRNFAQPIPHHASPNSIVVSELTFHEDLETEISFAVGQKMFPEIFSSWPDLSDWALLDRRVEVYSKLWARVKSSQVHAVAVASASYTPSSIASDVWWWKEGRKWYFQCQVNIQLCEYQRVQPGDLAVLSCEQGDAVVFLQGCLCKVKEEKHGRVNLVGQKWYTVEIELSEVSQFAKENQEATVMAATAFHLYFILVPPNEKKSIQLLQALPSSPPLQGMRLTMPRTTKQQQTAAEMRPLTTREQVFGALRDSASKVQNGGSMNERQTAALQRGLQRPFSMVQGPPGTGKTSFLVQFIVAALSVRDRRARPDFGRVLVCAPSNHAADHVLDRLISDTDVPAHLITRVYSRFIERAYGSLYKGGAWKAEFSFEIQPHLEEHSLHWKVHGTSQLRMAPPAYGHQKAYDKAYVEAETRVLNQSKIVITTCANAYLHSALMQEDKQQILRPVKFDTIVIDEAAQAPEPDVVLPSTCATTRVVVVGDHKQLGPVVPERNLCSPYVNILKMPFLERMLKNPRRWEASTMLNMQYRMHPSIRSFPSSQFYDSKLEDRVAIPHRPELNRIWPEAKEHRRFIDCRTPQSMGLSPELTRTCDAALTENKTSLKNVGEAKVAAGLCSLLLKEGCCEARDIAIITPYRAQQYEIRGRLQKDIPGSKHILVGTVHSLQGSERDFIIISFVRSISDDVQDIAPSEEATSMGDSLALREMRKTRLGILEDSRLLNVALTRAKYGLVCIGNSEVLSHGSKDYYDLIQDLKRRGCLVSREDFLQNGRSSQRLIRHKPRRCLNA